TAQTCRKLSRVFFKIDRIRLSSSNASTAHAFPSRRARDQGCVGSARPILRQTLAPAKTGALFYSQRWQYSLQSAAPRLWSAPAGTLTKAFSKSFGSLAILLANSFTFSALSNHPWGCLALR